MGYLSPDAPEAPEPPPPPPEVNDISDEVRSTRKKTRKRQRSLYGNQATVLNGGEGLLNPATTSGTTLLGG